MTEKVRLPYLLKRYGRHNMVRLVDPERLDLSQPFFRMAFSGDPQAETMVRLDDWLAEQPDPGNDFSDLCGIFHVSRCGSTLLARNIGESGQAVVLSEPPFFRVLRHRMDGNISPQEAIRACQAVLSAWLKWTQAKGLRLVVKFNSQLHLHQKELFEQLTGCRFLFLHREPVAVFESLHRKPPLYLQQCATWERIEPRTKVSGQDVHPLLAAAASRYCTALETFGELRKPNLLSVSYNQLGRRYSEILTHLGFDSRTAPPWSANGDAKALKNGQARAYTPVPAERVRQFEHDHAVILSIAAFSYQQFLDKQQILAG